MEQFETGMMVRSKSGHDAGKVYVITKVEEAYVYLVDGKVRTLDKPKKKKKKHVQLIKESLCLRNRHRYQLGDILTTHLHIQRFRPQATPLTNRASRLSPIAGLHHPVLYLIKILFHELKKIVDAV